MDFKIEDPQSMRDMMLKVWNFVTEKIEGGPLVVSVTKPSRSREQEKMYHAMINDISSQITFDGTRRYSTEVWKARLVEQFAREKELLGEPLAHAGETVISLDGKRVITVRPSTAKFKKAEAGEFIEYLYSQGSDMGVKWTTSAQAAYEQYRESV